MDTKVGVSGELGDEHSTKNCALFVPDWHGWTPYMCQINKAHVISCACEHPGQMYLQLRGLCPDSYIDTIYVPRNKRRSGAVMLIGQETTIIEYSKEEVAWQLTEHFHNTTALIDAPLETYVLGSHEWLIDNDHVKCSTKGKPYKTTLKLTGCREREFTCNNGQCIR